MSQHNRSVAEKVRAALALREDHAHSHADLYEVLAAGGMDVATRRETILQVLRYLTERGYVIKAGLRGTATFKASGKPMQKPLLPPGEAERRRRERNRLKYHRRKGSRPAPAPKPEREIMVDRNTVLIPKHPGAARAARAVPVETVDEFRERGGVVQRLPASWDQAA